jgi:hypothetical protein
MTTASEESTRTLLMRERFRARCVERAQRERERNVQRARFGDSSDVGSSDVEMEDEEDDDCILSDEVCVSLLLCIKTNGLSCPSFSAES